MKQLNREFRETVSLAMRFENHVEVVATVESPQLIRMGNTVGRILPPHASSLGKAITAFQPEDRRESLLRSYGLHRFTDHTIVDEVELKRELERIRKAGYSLDAEESALEGCCFGAPIRGADGSVIGAISLSMPKMRLTSDDQSQPHPRRAAGRAPRRRCRAGARDCEGLAAGARARADNGGGHDVARMEPCSKSGPQFHRMRRCRRAPGATAVVGGRPCVVRFEPRAVAVLTALAGGWSPLAARRGAASGAGARGAAGSRVPGRSPRRSTARDHRPRRQRDAARAQGGAGARRGGRRSARGLTLPVETTHGRRPAGRHCRRAHRRAAPGALGGALDRAGQARRRGLSDRGRLAGGPRHRSSWPGPTSAACCSASAGCCASCGWTRGSAHRAGRVAPVGDAGHAHPRPSARLPAQDQLLRRLDRRAVGAVHPRPRRLRHQRHRADSAALRRCADSPHFPLPPLEMMVEMSRIADDYGLDVWIWYPAMDKDYADPEDVEFALQEWGGVFEKLPRIDAVFVPGGDPGHTQPQHLLALLEKQTASLHQYHPKATDVGLAAGLHQGLDGRVLRSDGRRARRGSPASSSARRSAIRCRAACAESPSATRSAAIPTSPTACARSTRCPTGTSPTR